jgi:hypothetical protein
MAAHIPLPKADEDLSLYVTNDAGQFSYKDVAGDLSLYDVILARLTVKNAVIQSADGLDFEFLAAPIFAGSPLTQTLLSIKNRK